MKVIHFAVATVLTTLSHLAVANTQLTVKTNQGDIEIELFDKQAPLSTKNFIDYAKSGFYSGTVFHRVIDGFMIQGGGFNAAMQEKTTKAPIKNEATNGLKNSRGTLAMARTGEVNSATSQFFINLKDNGFLDNKGTSAQTYGYAVFGKVTKGMEVVDQIAKTKTGRQGFHYDIPLNPITILEVKVKNMK